MKLSQTHVLLAARHVSMTSSRECYIIPVSMTPSRVVYLSFPQIHPTDQVCNNEPDVEGDVYVRSRFVKKQKWFNV